MAVVDETFVTVAGELMVVETVFEVALAAPPPETVAEAVCGELAVLLTEYVAVIVVAFPAPELRGAVRVQLVAEHVQFVSVELRFVRVRPVLELGVTVMVPAVEPGPLFVTVIVYCKPVWPCAADAGPVSPIASTGGFVVMFKHQFQC